MLLKVNKKGSICRPDGTVLGLPSSDGSIRRGKVLTGCFDLEDGTVYDIKDNELGKVDLVAIGMKKVEDVVRESKEAKLKVVKNVESMKMNQEYVPGLDSHLVVTGKLTRILYNTIHNTDINSTTGARINIPVSLKVTDRLLDQFNKMVGSDYMNWEQVSAKCSFDAVSDDVLWKLHNKLDWYVFIKFQPQRFESIKRSVKDNIYNYMKKYKDDDYRALNSTL